MIVDVYAGIPVRRNLYRCDDWQRMAEDLMAFQDAVQEALGTEEAGHVLDAINRLKERAVRSYKGAFAVTPTEWFDQFPDAPGFDRPQWCAR